MAGIYSTKLMEAVRSLNDPIKTTSTTTAKSNEGLDIGGLLTMLMLSGMFKQPAAGATQSSQSSLLNTPATAGMPTLDKTLGSNAVPGMQNTGVSEILQLLSKLGPLFKQ